MPIRVRPSSPSPSRDAACSATTRSIIRPTVCQSTLMRAATVDFGAALTSQTQVSSKPLYAASYQAPAPPVLKGALRPSPARGSRCGREGRCACGSRSPGGPGPHHPAAALRRPRAGEFTEGEVGERQAGTKLASTARPWRSRPSARRQPVDAALSTSAKRACSTGAKVGQLLAQASSASRTAGRAISQEGGDLVAAREHPTRKWALPQADEDEELEQARGGGVGRCQRARGLREVAFDGGRPPGREHGAGQRCGCSRRRPLLRPPRW